MPGIGAFYVALMSRINGRADYAEITTSNVGNIKRAGVSRDTAQFPLVTSGRQIQNVLEIGGGEAGTANSFRASGTGFASGFDAEGWGVFDAASGGNFWFGAKFDAINGSVNRHVSAGNTFSIPAGGLRARFAAGGLTDFEAQNYLNVLFNGMGLSRSTYRVGLITDLNGSTPATTIFTNQKMAVLGRNTSVFPTTTVKQIVCGIKVGGGEPGSENSFLSGGNAAKVIQPIALYGVGVYEGTTGLLCWVIPGTSGLSLIDGCIPVVAAGRFVIQVS